MTVKIEVVCTSACDCVSAEEAGAHRIELCCALQLGGLTPSAGLMREAANATTLPIMAMIRPRESGFCYVESEIEAMRKDIDSLMSAGAKGVVFGVLTAHRRVNVEACSTLARAARGADIVFHRAFDASCDPERDLQTLIDVGVTRVLTSGCAPTALEGLDKLRSLAKIGDGRVEVMPCGGIRSDNVEKLVAAVRPKSIHLGASKWVRDASIPTNSGVRLGTSNEDESLYRRLDSSEVQKIEAILDVMPRE